MTSVAYLGNSVTAQQASYIDPLHRIVTERWAVEGVPRRAALGGVGSLAMAGLLDCLVLRHKPQVCFVECSLADAGGATPENRIALAVDSILGDLEAAGVPAVVIHLPRTDVSPDAQQSVVAIYDSIATRRGVRQIDVRHVAEFGGFRDGVHTSPKLSEVIAQTIGAQLGDMPSVSESASARLMGPRVRYVSAGLGASGGQHVRPATFRMSLNTMIVDVGGSIRLEAPGAQFLGIYVIARSSSGVIELRSGAESVTVQVWDEWCSRARIQFVHLPQRMGKGSDLEVAPTDLHAADRSPQGDKAFVLHQGSSIEVLGAAILTPGDHEHS